MERQRGIECNICMDKYTDPYSLVCYHSFCKKCIDGLENGEKVKCPLCSEISYRNVIKPNYALRDALQEMNLMDQRLKEQASHSNDVNFTANIRVQHLCDLCEKGKVEFRCNDCSDWLCAECRKGHTKIKVTKDHVLENLSECNSKMEKDISEQINLLIDNISQYTDNCNKFTGEICSIQQIQAATLTKLSDLREKIIKEIQTRFSELDNHIKLLCEDQVKKLLNYAEENGKPLESLKKRLQEINAEIQSNENHLAIIGKNILSDVKTLTDSHVPRDYRITPFSLEIVLTSAWEPMEILTLKHNSSQAQCDEVVLSSAWKPMDILTLKHNSSQVQCDEPCAAAPSLSCLQHRQWEEQESVVFGLLSNNLRLIEDKLWQLHGGGISVLTLDLDTIENISMFVIGYMKDVTNTGREEVVIATDRGLYSLNREHTVAVKIDQDNFSSVCYHADQLYAAHPISRTVRVYKRSGSKWTLKSSFSVDSGWATLSVNNNGVFMCVAEQHKLYRYSHSGELLSSTGTRGRDIDEMNTPFLCCVDSAGAALIADLLNSRLKLLSSNGCWSIIDLPTRVQRPRGALFYNDVLYVNSWNNKTLYMFKAR